MTEVHATNAKTILQSEMQQETLRPFVTKPTCFLLNQHKIGNWKGSTFCRNVNRHLEAHRNSRVPRNYPAQWWFMKQILVTKPEGRDQWPTTDTSYPSICRSCSQACPSAATENNSVHSWVSFQTIFFSSHHYLHWHYFTCHLIKFCQTSLLYHCLNFSPGSDHLIFQTLFPLVPYYTK